MVKVVALKSNIAIIEKFQSKALGSMVNALWFVTNKAIYNNFDVSIARELIVKCSERYTVRLKNHPNIHTSN